MVRLDDLGGLFQAKHPCESKPTSLETGDCSKERFGVMAGALQRAVPVLLRPVVVLLMGTQDILCEGCGAELPLPLLTPGCPLDHGQCPRLMYRAEG